MEASEDYYYRGKRSLLRLATLETSADYKHRAFVATKQGSYADLSNKSP